MASLTLSVSLKREITKKIGDKLGGTELSDVISQAQADSFLNLAGGRDTREFICTSRISSFDIDTLSLLLKGGAWQDFGKLPVTHSVSKPVMDLLLRITEKQSYEAILTRTGMSQITRIITLENTKPADTPYNDFELELIDLLMKHLGSTSTLFALPDYTSIHIEETIRLSNAAMVDELNRTDDSEENDMAKDTWTENNEERLSMFRSHGFMTWQEVLGYDMPITNGKEENVLLKPTIIGDPEK